jgi:hypothetical protein
LSLIPEYAENIFDGYFNLNNVNLKGFIFRVLEFEFLNQFSDDEQMISQIGIKFPKIKEFFMHRKSLHEESIELVSSLRKSFEFTYGKKSVNMTKLTFYDISIETQNISPEYLSDVEEYFYNLYLNKYKTSMLEDYLGDILANLKEYLDK